MFAGEEFLRPIGPYVIGEIVGYVQKQREIERELMSCRRWHVLHVHTGQERKIVAEIEKLGLASYLPIEPYKRRIHARLHRTCFRPIYPGYLFVGFDPEGKRWQALNDVEGVIRLLTVDDRPISLADVVMARIREIEGLRLNQRTVIPMPVKVGAVIRIIEFGGFTGLFAPVIGLDAEARRVQIDLDLFGRKVPMWLQVENIEAV